MLRRALPAVALASLTLLASAGPTAEAASTPGWRVVSTIGPNPGVTSVGNFVAAGRDDAWSTWGDCAPCNGPHQANAFWVEHWDGRAWRLVRLPLAFTGFETSTLTVAASSRDAWLFNPAIKREALYRNGRRWSARTLPAWVVRSNLSGGTSLAAADFGPADLWVFSLGATSFAPVAPFAARFNGRRWTKARLPGIPDAVSAVSPKDIWVLGCPVSLKGGSFLMHWNGRSWHRLAVPKVKAPAHSIELVRNLLATGPHDVWLQRDIERGSQGARTLYLLRWNGTSWQRVRFGFPTSFADYLAQDGHGGLWIVANGPGPGFPWYFYHLAGGHWSRRLVPASTGTTLQQLTTLSSIPGTRSMWATGGLLPVHDTVDVLGGIWKFDS